MRAVYLLVLMIVGILVFVGCSPTPSKAGGVKVRLSQDIIDAAVGESRDKTLWGINLASVRINYVQDVTVIGALVLHNGNDAERLVELRYQTADERTLDKKTGKWHDPAPIQASEWVSIGVETMRLKEMETEVVEIRFMVPGDFELESEHWEFRIMASGTTIRECRQELVVTTVAGDTTLSVRLHHPLLQDSADAIKEIKSDIPEDLRILNYNPETVTLLIGGLTELEERRITIVYEHGEMVVIEYGQRWLITMI